MDLTGGQEAPDTAHTSRRNWATYGLQTEL
jgi:hypothetical protein